ncbi:uncharacterized protein LOC132394487 isoform X2 [Hypanus sabinus]|uniref:uncharacterized protein LOC132394487 isoform X2 n=1 Tax=Hypanus sabinus TaxID=79690 RepID=UPI0028C4C7B3|nr:uncharacterized protein LOC132394487 isoform X2 [Hypanus sabinus]
MFCSYFLSLFLLMSLGAAEKQKVVIGTIGSSVFLDPEHQSDLSGSEILWTFTGSNKSPVIILDYLPDKTVEEPNEQFGSRLQFNVSTGCLLVDRTKPEDQGFYNFFIDGRRTKTIQLLLFDASGEDCIIIIASIAGLVSSLVSHSGFLVLSRLEKNSKRVFQSLIICNILSVVATFAALISWIAIKGAAFISVVALCTVSALFLAIITPNVVLKFGCSFNEKFQRTKDSQPFIALSGFIIIPISITVIKEEIQQNEEHCRTSVLAWSIPIALLVSCVIIMVVFLATYCWKYNSNENGSIEERQQNNEESSDFCNPDSQQGASADSLQALQNGLE